MLEVPPLVCLSTADPPGKGEVQLEYNVERAKCIAVE